MRARGLKLSVAAGADVPKLSRPMRARGLKLKIDYFTLFDLESRPMRARGLKQNNIKCCLISYPVAPHAGAWIET